MLVSAASAYEIEYKRQRDPLMAAVPEALEPAVLGQGFSWAPITPATAVAAARLPIHHRDSWDRLLVAQAIDEQALLVTADAKLKAYPAAILW